MKRKIASIFLCGAAIASTGMFTSCDDDNNLDTRVSVLESAITDLQDQIGKALTAGYTVLSADQDENGVWTLALSNGQQIKITPSAGGNTGGSGGSGSFVNVVVTDTEAIITIDGEEYHLPLGPAVGSLTFAPDFEDGEVLISSQDGATAYFLVRPALASLDGAEFTVAESHKLNTRAVGEVDFKVSNASIENGLVKLNIRCLNGDLAGTKHATSIQLKYKGTVIGSNYFTINVDPSFSFSNEALDDNITVKNGTKLEDGSWTFTTEGAAILNGLDFTSIFEGVPAGATYAIASKQPEGKASEKRELLAASLNADGNFNFAERPGTSFNDNKEQPGFLVNVVKDDQVIAKSYVVIHDAVAEAADLIMTLPAVGQHMEWGVANDDRSDNAGPGGLFLEPGAGQSINLPEVFLKGELCLGHGQTWNVIDYLPTYANNFIYAGSKNFELTDDGKAYAKNSIGIRWMSTQNSVASSERRNWTDDEKKDSNGDNNGEIIGGWDGTFQLPEIGLELSDAGVLSTTADYKGWALRLGIEVRYHYDFGEITLHSDKLAFLWIGRRNCAAGVVDPDAK